jgi:hypothetical protein
MFCDSLRVSSRRRRGSCYEDKYYRAFPDNRVDVASGGRLRSRDNHRVSSRRRRDEIATGRRKQERRYYQGLSRQELVSLV